MLTNSEVIKKLDQIKDVEVIPDNSLSSEEDKDYWMIFEKNNLVAMLYNKNYNCSTPIPELKNTIYACVFKEDKKIRQVPQKDIDKLTILLKELTGDKVYDAEDLTHKNYDSLKPL